MKFISSKYETLNLRSLITNKTDTTIYETLVHYTTNLLPILSINVE